LGLRRSIDLLWLGGLLLGLLMTPLLRILRILLRRLLSKGLLLIDSLSRSGLLLADLDLRGWLLLLTLEAPNRQRHRRIWQLLLFLVGVWALAPQIQTLSSG